MGKKSAERRKHAETAKANGQALADEEGAVYRQNNRLWWAFSRRLGLWYGIILGATGFVCACDDQQGRGGICKHVVAVNVHLDRMWHAAKNAKRRMKHIRTPKLRCPHKECRSKDFIKHGTCSEYSKKMRHHLCRKCKTCSQNPECSERTRRRLCAKCDYCIKKFSEKKQRYLCKKCNRTFSGIPGFSGRHYSPSIIRRGLDDHVSGKSLGAVARGLGYDHIVVSRTTIYRWSNDYSRLLDRFMRSLRPIVGLKWHCDEIFHKISGVDRWLFAVMDGKTRYILSHDASGTKFGYKPRPLFEAARRVAGVDPWIFVTDGLAAFEKAAIKAFRRRKGFRLLHIRDIHLQNIFNTNNIYERLNGEFKDRIKTGRRFKRKLDKKTDHKLGHGCPALLRLLVIHHNFFKPHSALDGKTPAEAAGIIIHGDDKWVAMIANAAQA